jgi:hypothetical protein
MIYEVCVLVLTIVFSVVGIHLVLVLHNAKGLLMELQQAAKNVNKSLPVLLADIEGTIAEVENLAETIHGCVDLCKGKILGPLCSFANFFNAAKVGFSMMQRRYKESKERGKTETDQKAGCAAAGSAPENKAAEQEM